MFLRKLSWAQLTKGGVPPLFVLRPMGGGFTPPNVGDEFPAPKASDKLQMQRARQMYEQRRIGTQAELAVTLAKSKPAQSESAAPEKPAKPRKEKGRVN